MMAAVFGADCRMVNSGFGCVMDYRRGLIYFEFLQLKTLNQMEVIAQMFHDAADIVEALHF